MTRLPGEEPVEEAGVSSAAPASDEARGSWDSLGAGHHRLRVSTPPRPFTPPPELGLGPSQQAPKSPGAKRWQNLRNRLIPTRSLGTRPLDRQPDGDDGGGNKFSWRSMSIAGWTRPSLAVLGGPSAQQQQPVTPHGAGTYHADTAPALSPVLTSRASPERVIVPEADRADRGVIALRKIPLLVPFIPVKLRGQLAGTYTRALSSIAEGMAAPSGLSGSEVSRAMKPALLRQVGAVMIADVTGFTALTELLSQQGSVGLELLTRCMNKYFTQVIDEIVLHGGDVMRFAGDSMIVLFSPTKEEAASSLDGGLQSALMRAVACAHTLTRKYGAMRMLPNGDVVEYVLPQSDADGTDDQQQGQDEAAGREGSTSVRDSSGFRSSAGAGSSSSGDRLLSPVGSLLGSAGRPVAATILGAADSVSVAVEGILVGAASAASRTKARQRERALASRMGLASVDEMGMMSSSAGESNGSSLQPGSDSWTSPPTREPSSSVTRAPSGVAVSSAGAGGALASGPSVSKITRHCRNGSSSESEGNLQGDASETTIQAEELRPSSVSSPGLVSPHAASSVDAPPTPFAEADASATANSNSMTDAASINNPQPTTQQTSSMQSLSSEGLIAQMQSGGGAMGSTSSSAQERALQEIALARLAEFTGQLKSVRPPELPPHRGARMFSGSTVGSQERGTMSGSVSIAELAHGGVVGSGMSHASSGPAAIPDREDGSVRLGRARPMSEPGVPGHRPGVAAAALARGAGPLFVQDVESGAAGVLPPPPPPPPLSSTTGAAVPEKSSGDISSGGVLLPSISTGGGATINAGSPNPVGAEMRSNAQPTIAEEASELASTSCEPSAASMTEPSGPSEALSWGSGNLGRPPVSGPSRRQGSGQVLGRGLPSYLGNSNVGRGGVVLAGSSSRGPSGVASRSISKLVKSVRAAISRQFGGSGSSSFGSSVETGGNRRHPSSLAATGRRPSSSRGAGNALSMGWRPTAIDGGGGETLSGTSLVGLTSLADLSDRLGDVAGRTGSLNLSGSLSSPMARATDSGTMGGKGGAGSAASESTLGGDDAVLSTSSRKSRRRRLSRRGSRRQSATVDAAARLAEVQAAGGTGAPLNGALSSVALTGDTRQPKALNVTESSDKVLLSMKMLVSAGTVCLFHVGGGLEPSDEEAGGCPRWDFFMADAPHALPGSKRQPIAQLAAIEKHAKSGETVISEEAARLLNSKCQLVRLDEGTHRLISPAPTGESATRNASLTAAALLGTAGHAGPLQQAFSRHQLTQDETDDDGPAAKEGGDDDKDGAASPPESSAAPLRSPTESAQSMGTPRPDQCKDADASPLLALPSDKRYRALQLMRTFVPLSVRKRIELGHIDYLHETRLVTVLFLGFPGLTRPLLKKSRRPDIHWPETAAPDDMPAIVPSSKSAPAASLMQGSHNEEGKEGKHVPAHSAASAPAALGEVLGHQSSTKPPLADETARSASVPEGASEENKEEEQRLPGALASASQDDAHDASVAGEPSGTSHDTSIGVNEHGTSTHDDEAEQQDQSSGDHGQSVDNAHFTGTPPPPPQPVYTAATEEEEIASVQTTLEVIQRRMRRYDGCLMQMRCDEKGFLAICVFGLPGNSHEDRAVRGVHAAMSIASGLKRHGLSTHIGVTSGQLFCTLVGSSRRMESTLFGDSINLSARLMCKARDGLGTILVDRPTFVQARMRIPFRELEPLMVKGRAEPINVFVPLPAGSPMDSSTSMSFTGTMESRFEAGIGSSLLAPAASGSVTTNAVQSGGSTTAAILRLAEPSTSSHQPQAMVHIPESVASDDAGAVIGPDGSAIGDSRVAALRRVGSLATAPPLSNMPELKPMVGRRRELGIVLARARALVSDHQGGVILIEGEHGMGKTRLAAEIQTDLLAGQAGKVFTVTGRGVVERRTDAFYAWRRVFAALFLHDAEAAKAEEEASTFSVEEEKKKVPVKSFGSGRTGGSVRFDDEQEERKEEQHQHVEDQDIPSSPQDYSTSPVGNNETTDDGLSTPQAMSSPFTSPPSRSVSNVSSARTRSTTSGGGLPAAHPGSPAKSPKGTDSTPLARRLACRVPRYAMWRSTLADALHLPVEALPPIVPGISSTSEGDIASRFGGEEEVHAHTNPSNQPLTASPVLSSLHLPAAHKSVNIAMLQSGTLQAAGAGHYSSWRREREHGESAALITDKLNHPAEPSSPRQQPAIATSTSLAHQPSQLLPGNATDEEGGSPGGSLAGSEISDLGGDGGSIARPSIANVTTGVHGAYVAAAQAAAQAGSSHGPSMMERLPQHKTQQLQELLVEILREFTLCYGPLVIMIEDVHYCDTSSWVLSWLLSRELSRSVLYIATYRPGFTQLSSSSQRSKDRKAVMVQKIRDALHRMLRESTTVHLQLAPFDPEETREFVAYALPGIKVPDHVMNMLWEKSSGHPAFLEQFVVFLQYYSRMAAHALATGNVPPGGGPSTFQLVSRGMEFIRNTVGIHSIIQDRVDRLPPEHALTLKVASVGGLTIYVDLLQAAHPQNPTLEQVLASLDFLQSAGFVQQDAMDDNLWRFTQVLARDVVFDTIPITQRREWHGRLARAMERLAPELPLPASTIAYHWSESCAGLEVAQWPRALKAMEYWESAAVQAVDSGTPAEAINLLQKAQDLAETLDRYFVTHTHSVWMIRGSGDGRLPIVPRARRIHWERCMAAMSGGAGLTRESATQCEVHCLRALALAGLPMPWEEAYLSQDRWRRRLRMDWRPRSRLLRACFGYSPEPFYAILERRMATAEQESLFLMRPLPLGPDGPDGAAPDGLMSKPGIASTHDSWAREDDDSLSEDPYMPNIRDEIIYVLDILCICLFLARPIDNEGLRYIMWVCRYIQAQAPWSKWVPLQRIIADVRTAMSDSEARQKKFLRVAPLVGLSEHLVEAVTSSKQQQQ